MKATLLPSVFLAAALGCGATQTRVTTAFSPDWENDGGSAATALAQKLASVPIAPAADVAVGVTETGLIGIPLSGGRAWFFAHAIDARPAIASNVVVATGSQEVFALDATTGRRLWARKAAGALKGIGDDGKTTVVSLRATGDNATTLLAVGRDGSLVRQLEVEPAVGVPAVVGGYAFLPWQGQYVTAWDLQSGDEVARLLFREQVSRAFTSGKKLYMGELGIFRFDERIGQAHQRRASHVALPPREFPGTPTLFPPGTDTSAVVAEARDRVGLFARPADKPDLAIDSDRFFSTYFKIALGLYTASGKLAWVHTHPSDFVAGAPFAGGIALCDTEGQVTFLDAHTGGVLGSVSLGKKVQSCVVQADGLNKPGPAAPVKSLAMQINDAAEVTENEMVAVQRVLVGDLAALDDPAATKVLIDFASNPKTSPDLLPGIRTALAARRNGADHMIAALGRHYDFLKDVLSPPPVGPMADALAAMKETRAAAVLAQHLGDPANSSDDVKRVAAALVRIGTKDQVDKLSTFFALYRSIAEDENIVQAVVSAAEAIMKLGGPQERDSVAKAAGDPMTVPPVKQGILRLSAPAE
jgi:outer membrane protein assembly factor BamB